MSTRVMVVDDTAIFRRIVSDALAELPGVQVVGTAANGRLALSRLNAIQADLMTLDIEMPEMNGIEVLEALRKAGSKVGVIVLSSLTRRGGELTMRALELGAFDFVTKPEGGDAAGNLAQLRARLSPMIHAFEARRQVRSMLHGVSRPDGPPPKFAVPGLDQPAARKLTRKGKPIVLIGVSTGGPIALAKVIPALPAKLGTPVFIVQHMPPLFTQSLASTLAGKSALRVKEAEDGEIAAPNTVYLAPGGKQMKIGPGQQDDIVIRITDDPPENHCKPAVDYLFRSAATHFPGRAVAAILTGMGNDGTAGLQLLKRGGCYSIAQDEASCVVFGMPKEAIQAGVVDQVVPLDQVAGAILRAVQE